MRIHYLMEPGPDTVISVTFTGKYILPHPQDASKSYLKMKRLLKGCQHFRLWNLERQFIDKAHVWELGCFLDDEVELLLPECEKLGLSIEFRVASDND
ncbi:hypothetical protein [Massilia rubra]|uniref:Uncharacterized protein n=1 Tax=Massilia rubra TaxID=2607910 RepID=A0ABX0LL08_9BURK|nr:hypothetical protein [Massilia rubra]NHZ35546.1 hypothetical protein [Massilia rubra]